MKFKAGDTVYEKPFRHSKYLIKCEILSINNNVIVLLEEGRSTTLNFVIDNYWGGKLLSKEEYFKYLLDQTI